MQTPTLGGRVAAEVRAELSRRRLSAVDAAAVLNLSRSSAYRRINGGQPFTLDEIDALAAWLDVPLAQLLGDERRSA